jgi:hypothetical protein
MGTRSRSCRRATTTCSFESRLLFPPGRGVRQGRAMLHSRYVIYFTLVVIVLTFFVLSVVKGAS